MRHSIQSRAAKLDGFFDRASNTQIPEESQADLAKFGSVLICGFIERCVEIVILNRLDQRAHPRVLSFIKGHFKRGTNYECEAIRQLLERFDINWAVKFKVFLDNNDRVVQSINSAYTLRNSIAHGGDGNRGLRGVQELWANAQDVVDGLIDATM